MKCDMLGQQFRSFRLFFSQFTVLILIARCNRRRASSCVDLFVSEGGASC